MIEILSSERRDNKKGKWLVLTGKNEKGEDRTWNVFDSEENGKRIINESFKGPGKYKETMVKNGQYWNLATLEVIAGTSTPTSAPQAAAPSAAAPVAAVSTQAVRKWGRPEVAAVCVGASALLYAGKNDQDQGDKAIITARALMKECETFISGGKKETEGA